MTITPKNSSFPFDFIKDDSMPGSVGKVLRSLQPLSMFPPYPWGQWLYSRVLQERCLDLEGDLAEFGVGKGGMSLFLGFIARTMGCKVYSYDSFEGLPPPTEKDNPYFREGDYRSNPARGDLLERFKSEIAERELSETVIPIKGFFDQSLKDLPKDRRFKFVHIDGDLYESIHVVLTRVYDQVVDGGVIVIDDYFHHVQGPVRALADFMNARRIHPALHVSFPYSVFFIKGEEFDTKNGLLRSLDGNTYRFDYLRSDEQLLAQARRSVESAPRGSLAESNGRLFLELLTRTSYSNSDIYVYWKAMEEFWDRISRNDERPTKEI